MRRRAVPFAFQRRAHCTRALGRHLLGAARASLGCIPFRLFPCPLGGGSLFRRRQLNACAPRFGKPDRNGLLRASRSVLSLTNMVHLFAHELARLRAGRFALASVFARPLDCSFFWHDNHEAVRMPALDYASTRVRCCRQDLSRFKLASAVEKYATSLPAAVVST
jgi:hypothetical protein